MHPPKKTPILFGLILIISAGLLYRCTSRKPGESGKSTEKIAQVQDQEKELQPTSDGAPPEAEYVPTSIDKIDEAYSTGKISPDKFARLEIAAVYSPDKLPADYRGAEEKISSPDYIYGFIHTKWPTFSQETKDALLPFLLPPDEPQSYFYSDADSRSILEKLSSAATAKAAPADTWIHITPWAGLTISYNKADETRDFQPAAWAADTAQIAIPKYRALLGLAGGKIHIYITDPAKVGANYGDAVMSTKEANLCDIRIKGGMDERLTRATAAHEIFHAFQFFMGLDYGLPEVAWLSEATATWSEDFVHKKFQTEHEYDPTFMDHTIWDLLDRRDGHHYGSYLWFYFLTQKFGPEQVAWALTRSKGGDARKALKETQDFPENFKHFVYWNWNWPPFEVYKDELNPPNFEEVHPAHGSTRQLVVKAPGTYGERVELTTASSKYVYINFPNRNPRRIEFDNSEFMPVKGLNQATRALQAFYKVGSTWYYEDWSSLEKRTFCRDVEEENVSVVVVVTSNSSLYLKTGGTVKLNADNKCHPGWRGTIRVNWKMDQNQNPQGTWRVSEKGSYTIMEELEFSGANDSLDIKTTHFTAVYSSSEIIQGKATDCTPYEAHGANISGAASYEYTAENTPDHRRPGRFYGTDVREPGKLGGTYSLQLGLPDPPVGAPPPLRGTSWTKKLVRNCTFLSDLPDFSANIDAVYPITDPTIYSVNPEDVVIDPKAKRIKGSAQFEIHSGVFGTVEWFFQKIE